MNGNPRTLFTWFGKSDRPVATIASGRTAITSSGRISGSGFARAKMIGLSPIFFTMSFLTTPPTDSPTNTSASLRASLSVRALVLAAKRALYASTLSRPW